MSDARPIKKDATFIIHAEWKDLFLNLTNEEASQLILRMYEYAETGEYKISLNPKINEAFAAMKDQIDWDQKHMQRYVSFKCDTCAHLDICWGQNSVPLCQSNEQDHFVAQELMGDI